jgi:hypothetical protein
MNIEKISLIIIIIYLVILHCKKIIENILLLPMILEALLKKYIIQIWKQLGN